MVEARVSGITSLGSYNVPVGTKVNLGFFSQIPVQKPVYVSTPLSQRASNQPVTQPISYRISEPEKAFFGQQPPLPSLIKTPPPLGMQSQLPEVRVRVQPSQHASQVVDNALGIPFPNVRVQQPSTQYPEYPPIGYNIPSNAKRAQAEQLTILRQDAVSNTNMRQPISYWIKPYEEVMFPRPQWAQTSPALPRSPISQTLGTVGKSMPSVLTKPMPKPTQMMQSQLPEVRVRQPTVRNALPQTRQPYGELSPSEKYERDKQQFYANQEGKQLFRNLAVVAPGLLPTESLKSEKDVTPREIFKGSPYPLQQPKSYATEWIQNPDNKFPILTFKNVANIAKKYGGYRSVDNWGLQKPIASQTLGMVRPMQQQQMPKPMQMPKSNFSLAYRNVKDKI